MGTSPISRAPLRRYWRTCFMSFSKKLAKVGASSLVSCWHERIQRAGEVCLHPVDRRFAAVVVHEQPVPDFQDEHQPDPLLPVDAAPDMIAHDAAHHIGVV